MEHIDNFIKLFLCLFFLSLFSCKKDSNDKIEIQYLDYNIYLKEDENMESLMPPILHMRFKIKNLSNKVKIFVCKGSSYDDIKSNMYMLDTINKIKINLFSDDIKIINPNETIYIATNIEIAKNKIAFGLKEDFFNKLDFNNDRGKIQQKFINLLSSSTINYEQNSTDINFFKLQNKNITSLNGIIKINKEPDRSDMTKYSRER